MPKITLIYFIENRGIPMLHVDPLVLTELTETIDDLSVLSMSALNSCFSPDLAQCRVEPGLQLLATIHSQVLLGSVGTYLGVSIRPAIDGLCGVLT